MSELPDRTQSTWKPGRSYAIGVAVIAVLIACVIAISVWGSVRASDERDQLVAERANAQKQIAKLEHDLEEVKKQAKVIEQRARKIDKRVGPVFRKYRAADKDRDLLKGRVAELKSSFDDWVEVPDVGVDSQSLAQSKLDSAGLAWTTETVEGSCSDYQDHFVDRGYGWDDVVKQNPAPGSRVPEGGYVTIYIWDYYSGWELGCNE